jgi:hypothetical protein
MKIALTIALLLVAASCVHITSKGHALASQKEKGDDYE